MNFFEEWSSILEELEINDLVMDSHGLILNDAL
jgi:hypothetical protein